MARRIKDYSESSTEIEEQQPGTHTEADGQIALTEANTPLYIASENLIKAKAQLHGVMKAFDDAEEAWVEAMKESKQGKINHKGDCIQLVQGKTTRDHSRFTKR